MARGTFKSGAIWLTASDSGARALIVQRFLWTSASRGAFRFERSETFLCPFPRRAADLTRRIIWVVHRTKIELFSRPKGKPALRNSSRIRFNTSHSGRMALYAFTLVVVNLELTSNSFGSWRTRNGLRTLFFGGRGLRIALSETGRQRSGLFPLLDSKEAYVKAVGDGLAIPLNRFQVTLLPGAPARFVQITSDMGTPSDWTLAHLELAAGLVVAIAIADSPRPTTIHPAVRAEKLTEILQARSSQG